MNAATGWIVAAVVIIAAGAFYFWSSKTEAPAMAETGMQQQAAATQENAGDPAMSGMWQSNTDAKFTREIRPDGVMIDRYEGDMGAGTGGEWSVVDPAKESVISDRAAALSGMTVIKVVWDGGVETTYFAVNKLDGKSMTTTDISGRGAVTVYTKVSQTP